MVTDAAVPVIRTQRLGKIYSAGTEARRLRGDHGAVWLG